MNFEKVIAKRNTKTVYKDNGRSIKLFVENYPKSNILNEAVNQARVEETGINVPALLEVTKMDGRWALVSEFIEGNTLDKLMDENPEKIDEYLEILVNTQLKVLSKRAPLLSRIKDKMKTKLKNASELDENTRYELLNRLSGIQVDDSVSHGDFNPSNLIVKEDGTVYVIDWSHVTQGSPAFDAARTYLLFNLDNKADIAEKYLTLFTQKSLVDKKEVLRCVPIVAATQLMKGNEQEKELLSKWIDVVDFE